MTAVRMLAFGVGVLLCTAITEGQSSDASALATLQTRAERSDFTETSRYDDVLAFLNVPTSTPARWRARRRRWPWCATSPAGSTPAGWTRWCCW